MTDQPFHHTPDYYTWLAQHTAIAYVLLLTPDGPTLWHHHVLLFGSAASVWAYNRFGDMLTAIDRTITCVPVVHYVDDYGSIEPNTFAESGFETFKQLNSLLGFHMKQSKRQPPAPARGVQGVIISCELATVTVEPCPDRIQNLLHQIQTHLSTKLMAPEQARKLAGKCSFTTTHLFGRVGRAALRALYDKAFSNNDQLSTHTISSLIALQNILQVCSPRRLPLRPSMERHTIIYTDTFYRDGDKQLRLHQLIDTPDLLTPSADTTNGWAAVVFHPDSTTPLVSMAQYHPDYSNTSPATRPSFTFLKPGQPSLHQS